MLDQATAAVGPQAGLLVTRADPAPPGARQEPPGPPLDGLHRVPADQQPALWKALGEFALGQGDPAAARRGLPRMGQAPARQPRAADGPARPRPRLGRRGRDPRRGRGAEGRRRAAELLTGGSPASRTCSATGPASPPTRPATPAARRGRRPDPRDPGDPAPAGRSATCSKAACWRSGARSTRRSPPTSRRST